MALVTQRSCTTSVHHQNSTAPDDEVNLPATQSLPLLPRVFLANGLNLVPADAGTDIGWCWLAAGGGGGSDFTLVFPVCWQLPVLPELVDGYTNNNCCNKHYKEF